MKTRLSKEKAIFIGGCSLCALSFLYLFFQLFIFSQNSSLLYFREVDDMAFQVHLKEAHEQYRLFKISGYAYGWLYWFPLVIATYPFHYLHSYFDIDMPLMVIPRLFSLSFTYAGAALLYRIAGLYTKDSILKWSTLFLFLSFPITGYFSQRFGTVGQTMFLAMLSTYFAARKEQMERKDLIQVSLCMAMAAATKLSGLLIAPLVTLLVFDRYRWSFRKEALKDYGLGMVVFALATLLLGQYNKRELLSQIKLTQTNQGAYVGPYLSFFQGIANLSLPSSIFFTLLAALFFESWRRWKRGEARAKDPLYFLISLGFISLYLIFTVKMGNFYISTYFTSVAFLLPLGMLAFHFFPTHYRPYPAIAFVLLSLFLNKERIIVADGHDYPVSWNAYYLKARSPKIQKELAVQQKLREQLAPFIATITPFEIFRDYRVPGPCSILDQGARDVITYDNFHIYPQKAYDLIGLSKSSHAFLDKESFHKQFGNIAPKSLEGFTKNRQWVQNFIKTQKLEGTNYQVLFEDESLIYYLKQSLRS